jgi:RHS repeat-associated protein
MTDATGSTQWFYTLDGRAMTTTQTIDGNVFTTAATTDAMGRLRTTTNPGGEQVTQTYNTQGLPATLGSFVTASNYNAAGQLTSMTFGNGVQTTYGYDSQNLRLMTLQTSGSNQNLGYTYDNVGNVKTITDNLFSPAQVTTFNYDDLNRLKDATLPNGYAQAWSYNSIGNMLVFTDTGVAKNYTYADTAHKHAVTQVGANYFCYDPNGNMTRRNAANASCTSGGDTLTYDVENHLISASVGITPTNYFYNGDGARVKKSYNGVTTYYVGALYEYTTWNGGNSTSKYYYFGSQRVAVKQDISISYLHSDHLGSTSKTTGASTSTQTYYPFGAIRTSSGAPPTDYGFTGQKRDATANLMYYGARYYDPALARFIQPDTIVPHPLNPQSRMNYTG